MRNVRFIFEGTKITMRPGSALAHRQGGPDDEGYWFRNTDLTCRDDGRVTADIAVGGRDCDGFLARYISLELVDGNWIDRDSYIHDEYAQAANY